MDGETACVKCFYAERARARDGSVETVVREKTALCLDVMDRPEEIGKKKFLSYFFVDPDLIFFLSYPTLLPLTTKEIFCVFSSNCARFSDLSLF
jgi:hypothetical protein